jgi:hypothetical protein
MNKLFFLIVLAVSVGPTYAGSVVYPKGTSASAIAVHEGVLRDMRMARSKRRHDPFRVYCPSDARGINFVRRDKSYYVRLDLKRDCYSGNGAGGDSN